MRNYRDAIVFMVVAFVGFGIGLSIWSEALRKLAQ